MSKDLERVQSRLQALAADETDPGALRIIDTLSKSLEQMRSDKLYADLETPAQVPEGEVAEFKKKAYAQLKTQRATDLAMAYNHKYFKEYSAAVCLAMATVLITIAKEQKVEYPPLWDRLLNSRGQL